MYRPDYKVHMPAADQSERTVGIRIHRPERTVVTFCGQVHNKRMLERIDYPLVTDDPEQATCKGCLHSYGVHVLGFKPGRVKPGVVLSRAEKLVDAVLLRLEHGPPLSNYDIMAIHQLARILGVDPERLPLE